MSCITCNKVAASVAACALLFSSASNIALAGTTVLAYPTTTGVPTSPAQPRLPEFLVVILAEQAQIVRVALATSLDDPHLAEHQNKRKKKALTAAKKNQ